MEPNGTRHDLDRKALVLTGQRRRNHDRELPTVGWRIINVTAPGRTIHDRERRSGDAFIRKDIG
jgi:hypothetical protein